MAAIYYTLLCTLAYCREEATDRDVPLTKPKQVSKCMQFGLFNSVFYSSDYDYDESSGYILTLVLALSGIISRKEVIFSFVYHRDILIYGLRLFLPTRSHSPFAIKVLVSPPDSEFNFKSN